MISLFASKRFKASVLDIFPPLMLSAKYNKFSIFIAHPCLSFLAETLLILPLISPLKSDDINKNL